MFFLLYVPEAKNPEAREVVKAQLQEMLTALQDQLEQAGLIELETGEADAEQMPANAAAVAELEPAETPETPELSNMRDYLERCFKKSA